MFADRAEAGRLLGGRLLSKNALGVSGPGGRGGPVVLGLPRGGLAVAAEVARTLREGGVDAALDVLVVRKLGVPRHPELAMGALGEGGGRYVDDSIMRRAGVSAAELARVEHEESACLERRAALYRSRRAREPLAGRVAVVVDDGIATGATARVACALVAREAQRVVLAVPVLPPALIRPLREVVDMLVWLDAPPELYAVGAWYEDFTQLTDDDVLALLSAADGGS